MRGILSVIAAYLSPSPPSPQPVTPGLSKADWIRSLSPDPEMVAANNRREAARTVAWAVERSERDWLWTEPADGTAKVTRAWMLQLDSIEMAAICLASSQGIAEHFGGHTLVGLPPRNCTDIEAFRRDHAAERKAVRLEWDAHIAHLRERARASASTRSDRAGAASGGGPRAKNPTRF